MTAPDMRPQAERIGEPAQKKAIVERVREFGNPAVPGHPGDLKSCDLAAMEDKLMGVFYAADEWIDPTWGDNFKPCDNRL